MPVRAYVAEPFAIPSESMAPTLRPGDHVLVEKLSYRFGSPRRGDLVVFRAPDGGSLAVKRIVGLAGDRVAIEDGVLAVNGHLQREPYVDQKQVDSVYFGPVVVPARRRLRDGRQPRGLARLARLRRGAARVADRPRAGHALAPVPLRA